MKKTTNSKDAFIKNSFEIKKAHTFAEKIQQLIASYVSKQQVSEQYNTQVLADAFAFQSIPEIGYSEEEFIEELAKKLLPYTTYVGTPNFIGHMTTALPNFIPEVASLVATLNQNVVKIETSQAATFYERQAIAMLHELMYENTETFYHEHIHNIDSTLGIVTSGGTIANISALQCARNRMFPHMEKTGNNTGKIGVVICSELGHYSLKKAMGILGLGSDQLVIVPTDAHNKIRIDLLEKAIQNCQELEQHIVALIGIAGTTECGSIDPLEAMAALAATHDIYFHVDAAWGGPTLLSDKYKPLLKGIEKADSITIDGHKQLYLPMGIGVVLFKNPTTSESIEKESEYIIRKTSIDLGKRSIEGSRPFHSFYVQAGFKLLGKQKYAWLIEKGIETAREMATYVETLQDFELLTAAETNIFLYRCLPKSIHSNEDSIITDITKMNNKINVFNKAIQQKQMKQGNTFVSYTTVALEKYNKQKIVGLRVVVANPLITLAHFKKSIEEQRTLASTIESNL
ncbi:MAG: aminotransferase class V-fold PLP-dependent enzyme [Bacteroidota bacterium]